MRIMGLFVLLDFVSPHAVELSFIYGGDLGDLQKSRWWFSKAYNIRIFVLSLPANGPEDRSRLTSGLTQAGLYLSDSALYCPESVCIFPSMISKYPEPCV